ncbi:MAG TPA: (2Fe-2S)-binding protein [Acidobacteriota bacterium]|nr:(2Fe-2S)-binding protein [Acidobacteriota bacterium]
MAKSRDPETKPRKGLSRRAFLSRSTGLAVSTPILASVGLAAPAAAAADVKILGPGKVPITLQINGKPYNLRVEPRVTLLDALRNNLDFTGAKRVCDRAACGSCTVLMDGKAVYACAVLAIEGQGKQITTIESLSSESKLHPVQAAFVQHDAQQCGFCTPGFVMACKALLDKNPNPSINQIREGLGGNLCRCGTYAGIRQVVMTAGKAMKGGQANG